MKKGTFCISIDFELLWGRRNRADMNYFIPKIEKERGLAGIVNTLLILFEKYNLPATWATVGKIFTDSGEKDNYLWSGRDIIKLIRNHTDQEIACHSYTHPEFDQIPRFQAEEEIAQCLAIAKKEGIKMLSFVFPRNKINHLDVLKEHGFKAYRGDEINYPEFTNLTHDTIKILKMLFLPKTAKVSLKHGLVEIPGTMYFFSARGMKKYTPNGLRYMKAKMSLDQAIAKKELFHLWFHPVDFAENKEALLKEFEKILAYAAKKRDQGLLEIKTMVQIADDFLREKKAS